jgi:MFS transporter, SP family, solute carrier family 2 (myo-inositol transporter), member 13
MSSPKAPSLSPQVYGRLLLFVASLGGLLYGIDIGIIAAALLYVGKTISLSIGETSLIVAAVLGGGMISSPAAGLLADRFGRKKIMVVGGMLFVASIAFIVLSQGFVPLFLGRLLQGISGGFIAVVVPLYLAETLDAETRGKGTALFQFMLTVGIAIAALIGWFYTRQAELAVSRSAGNAALIRAAQEHAWRGMFLSVIYPGALFLVGALLLSESPRWLIRKGRKQDGLDALRRTASSNYDAEIEFDEIESLITQKQSRAGSDSLWHKKYIIPFALSCLILACNQATGINTVLGFMVVILKHAGMSATRATQGDVIVKLLNCVMTLVAVSLVDKKGRKFLLKLGTGGIIISLSTAALLFYLSESRRVDIKAQVQSAQRGNIVTYPFTWDPSKSSGEMALTVLYTYGDGDRVATVLSDDDKPILHIQPEEQTTDGRIPTLMIKRAFYVPVASEHTGWLITACLALFIASFAVGPGVVVWLTLSELMPMRIRSRGMGIALLLNQGVSTIIAGTFLPMVGNYGYYAIFSFWAGCTVIYFLVATFYLPETKGKTLEQIEVHFER